MITMNLPSQVMTNEFPTFPPEEGWTLVADDGTTREFRSSPRGSFMILPIGTVRRKLIDHRVPPDTTITVRRLGDGGGCEVSFPYDFR
jgi:hypothetical protein